MANFGVLGQILKIVLVSIVTFFVMILLISILPLLISIYIFRYIVEISSKSLRPDLQKILTCRSCVFAIDDLYNKPRAPLVVNFFIKGDILDFEGGFVKERLIDLRNEKTGERLRPELTQFIYRWMGFYFWKEEENFDIVDHVYEYNGKFKSKAYDDLITYKITDEITNKPFVKGKSPWEFVIMHNWKFNPDDENEEGHTSVLFRIHHALADGFTILKLISELMESEGSLLPMEAKVKVKVIRPTNSKLKKVWNALTLPFRVPYDIIANIIEVYDSNPWHLPSKKLSDINVGALHDKIPLQYLKDIKNMYDVSLTSLILAGFAGGLRNLMLEYGVKVPTNIHCITPLPIPGHAHTDKMRNFMTICYVTLPVGMEDSEQRVRAIDKHLHELRTSIVPIFTFYFIPFIGGLFPFMTKLIARQFLVTAITSNFPGPQQEVTFRGRPLTDICFSGGLMPGDIGIGMTSISYNGYIRMVAGMDLNIMPKGAPMTALTDKIVEEFDVLKKQGSV